MDPYTPEEAAKELANRINAIQDALTQARNFATEHDLDFVLPTTLVRFATDYEELDSWEDSWESSGC